MAVLAQLVFCHFRASEDISISKESTDKSNQTFSRVTLLALLIFKIRYVCCFENCLFVSNLPWLLICRCSKMMQENSAPEATNRGNFGMTEILQFLKIARDYYSIVQFTTMYIMSSTIFKVFFSFNLVDHHP